MKNHKPITWAEFFLVVYYAWFFTPVLRAYFSGTFKYIFFGFFLAGVFFLLYAYLSSTDGKIKIGLNILWPIVCYLVVMTLMVAFNLDDASRHVRVSFTFWGTAIVYYLMGYDTEVRVRFGKVLIALFLLTTITSVIGIYAYEGAARALTNASRADEALEIDYMLSVRNISSIYLFQMLVVLVPVLVNWLKKKEKKGLLALLIAFIFVVVIKAGFMVSLLLLVMSTALSFMYTHKIGRKLFIVCFALIMLLVPWGDVMQHLALLIDDKYISIRLNELADLIRSGDAYGDTRSRIEVYMYSFQTFLKNPFGIGPYYSYIIGENGIGYHSQILDDMARFGVFAVAFYVLLLWQYYKLLRSEWKKINMADVALPIVVVWFAFLLLNIAFRSADESIIILYVLPVIPDIVVSRRDFALQRTGGGC